MKYIKQFFLPWMGTIFILMATVALGLRMFPQDMVRDVNWTGLLLGCAVISGAL